MSLDTVGTVYPYCCDYQYAYYIVQPNECLWGVHIIIWMVQVLNHFLFVREVYVTYHTLFTTFQKFALRYPSQLWDSQLPSSHFPYLDLWFCFWSSTAILKYEDSDSKKKKRWITLQSNSLLKHISKVFSIMNSYCRFLGKDCTLIFIFHCKLSLPFFSPENAIYSQNSLWLFEKYRFFTMVWKIFPSFKQEKNKL